MKKKVLYAILILFVILVVYSLVQDWRLNSTSFESRVVYVGQKAVRVNFVPKDSIYPAFGLAFSDEVRVRVDLSPRVKRFVLAHELYHTQDHSKWGGWVGREIRASIVPALSDPIGFVSTALASLSPSRLAFYFQRFKNGQ